MCFNGATRLAVLMLTQLGFAPVGYQKRTLLAVEVAPCGVASIEVFWLGGCGVKKCKCHNPCLRCAVRQAELAARLAARHLVRARARRGLVLLLLLFLAADRQRGSHRGGVVVLPKPKFGREKMRKKMRFPLCAACSTRDTPAESRGGARDGGGGGGGHVAGLDLTCVHPQPCALRNECELQRQNGKAVICLGVISHLPKKSPHVVIASRGPVKSIVTHSCARANTHGSQRRPHTPPTHPPTHTHTPHNMAAMTQALCGVTSNASSLKAKQSYKGAAAIPRVAASTRVASRRSGLSECRASPPSLHRVHPCAGLISPMSRSAIPRRRVVVATTPHIYPNAMRDKKEGSRGRGGWDVLFLPPRNRYPRHHPFWRLD
jgi:hypothetical protein